MLGGCLETSDRRKVEHGGDRGWPSVVSETPGRRPGPSDELQRAGMRQACRSGRHSAGEGVEEAATLARDQIGDQTRGRPNRSERESIERCARVSYRGDGVTLRTGCVDDVGDRSEEHTSELQSLRRISYAVFCLKKVMCL